MPIYSTNWTTATITSNDYETPAAVGAMQEFLGKPIGLLLALTYSQPNYWPTDYINTTLNSTNWTEA